MKYGFNVYKTQQEEHVFWVAESKDLKGCVGQGETLDEAIKELEINEIEWLDSAEEFGIEIPEQKIVREQEYKGKFVTRVSPLVHKEAVKNANEQGISLNQYVNNAIVTMNASNETAIAIKEIVNDMKSMMLSSTEQAWKYVKSNNTLKYSGTNNGLDVIFKYN